MFPGFQMNPFLMAAMMRQFGGGQMGGPGHAVDPMGGATSGTNAQGNPFINPMGAPQLGGMMGGRNPFPGPIDPSLLQAPPAIPFPFAGGPPGAPAPGGVPGANPFAPRQASTSALAPGIAPPAPPAPTQQPQQPGLLTWAQMFPNGVGPGN